MKLLKATATIGTITFISRILGFVRDMLTAIVMGAGPVSDAFFVALKLPNFCRRITAEGAFSAAFIPIFSGKIEKDGKEKALKFAQNVQSFMLAILLPFTAIIMIVMPFVIHVIAPGFVDDKVRFDLAVDLSRITFPYVILISIVALLGGMMNSFDRFAPFASMPIFFNFALIAALLFAMFFKGAFITPAHALALGVLGAGVMQLLWMLFHAFKMKILLPIQAPAVTGDIKKVFRRMGPAVVGAGVVQVNIFIDMILASTLPAGAISYLYYADRLYQFPLAIVGIAIGTAILPSLSKSIKAKRKDEAKALFSDAMKWGWIFSVPAAFGLALLSYKIIAVLFEYGAFSASDTEMAAKALQAYALALPAFIGVKILTSASHAAEDTKTPVIYAIIGAVVNIVMSIILLNIMGHVGIALATAIGAWVNLILLSFALKARNMAVTICLKDIKRIFSSIFSALFMSATIILTYAILPSEILNISKLIDIIVLLAVIVIGVGAYFFALFATGNKEIFIAVTKIFKK